MIANPWCCRVTGAVAIAMEPWRRRRLHCRSADRVARDELRDFKCGLDALDRISHAQVAGCSANVDGSLWRCHGCPVLRLRQASRRRTRRQPGRGALSGVGIRIAGSSA